jgi:xanthine dehydrogenase accessory factor
VTVVAPAAERSAFKQIDRSVEAIPDLARSAAERFIVVATQGKRDFDTLKSALETDIPFVAFIGSRRKAAALKAKLAEAGVAVAQIDRLRAPAGLWIGAITPEEIALSVVADVVRARRLGARSLTQASSGHAA